MHARALLVLSLLSACSASDADRRHPTTSAGPPLIARELLARRIASLENDSFPLFRPMSIRLLGDTLVIADMGNDRIALFDADLGLLHVFGKSGAGPGELQGPYNLQGWNGLIAVGDMTNRRVAFFRPDGGLVREVRLHESLRSFAVGDDGSVYHISTSGYDTYFTVIAPDGSRRRWGTRPRAMRPDTAGGAPAYTGLGSAFVVRTHDGAFHVLDALQGTLVRLDATGAPDTTFRLPDPLLDPIREATERLIRAFARQGTQVVAAPLIKDFSTTADGRLLLTLTSRDVIGLIVEPVTYALREIRIPSAAGPWEALKQASGLALRDDILYALTEEGVYAFAVEPARDR